MPFFEYTLDELDTLKASDCLLGGLIDRMGFIQRHLTPDPFTALTESIVSQQISTKAALSVCARLRELLGELIPENILNAQENSLRSCGLSGRKVGYIKGIAQAAQSGAIDFSRLGTLSDEEIISQLSSLKGVGVWTAEMLLIFSLNRKDILSFNDLGIRRGIMRLYKLEEITKKDFEAYRQRYSPYGSIASLYLWALAAEQ